MTEENTTPTEESTAPVEEDITPVEERKKASSSNFVKKSFDALEKQKSRTVKQRLGVYVEYDIDLKKRPELKDDKRNDERYCHTLNLLKALKSCKSSDGQSYEIHLFSSKKTWKRYAKDHGFIYRPFPTSGASTFLGKLLFGKGIDSPTPPEWVAGMMDRKVKDFKLAGMVCAGPTTIVEGLDLPCVVVMSDMAAENTTGAGHAHDPEWHRKMFQSMLDKATAVVVDTHEGVEKLQFAMDAAPATVMLFDFEPDPNSGLRELSIGLEDLLQDILKSQI